MTDFTGGCLCGRLRFRITGPLGTICHCHCSECRRWHGSAYRTRAAVDARLFFWTSGEENLGRYAQTETLTKTFCRECGSSLVSYYTDRPAVLGLALGTLDQDPGRRPEFHIYVDSKAPWHEILDNLPQYKEMPPDSGAVHQISDK